MRPLSPLKYQLFRRDPIAHYRILQEATNNVLKHSRATEVIVELKREENHVRLSILDDGRGLPPRSGSGNGGFGLQQIAERAKLLGGQFDIQSAQGKGVRLTVIIPIPK